MSCPSCLGYLVAIAVMIAAGAPIAVADDASVEIAGNRRTERGVIVDAARIPAGQLDEDALADVRQRVLNLRLFESVEVTMTGTIVTIRVKEKWTLIPIPFVSSSSRGMQGGLFILESNLFGRNKLLAVGGMYGSVAAQALAIYRDPSVAGTRVVIRANAQYTKATRERRVDDEVVDRYDDARSEAALLVGYRITDRLTLAGGWFFSRVAPDADPMYPKMALANSLEHGFAAFFEYRGADTKLYYDEGLTTTVELKQAGDSLGSDHDLLDVVARAKYTRGWFGSQATTLSAQVDVVDGDPILDAHLLGGRTGTRGFDQQTLWVDRAATLTLDHQVPFLRRKWGIWTATGFVDVGASRFAGETTKFATPGVGLRLYLPRVSFPALGVDVSYSTATERAYISAAIGLAF